MGHLGTSVSKCFKVEKRHGCCLCLQICFPLFFTGLGILIAALTKPTKFDAVTDPLGAGISPLTTGNCPFVFFADIKTGNLIQPDHIPVLNKGGSQVDSNMLDAVVSTMNSVCGGITNFRIIDPQTDVTELMNKNTTNFGGALMVYELDVPSRVVNFSVALPYLPDASGDSVPSTREVSPRGQNVFFVTYSDIINQRTDFRPCKGNEASCVSDNGFLRSNFVWLQTVFQNAVLLAISSAQGTAAVTPLPRLDLLASMPHPEITQSVDLSSLSSNFVISFIPFAFMSVNLLIKEKERKIKEALLIMGMPRSAYWGGWVLATLIKAIPVWFLIFIGAVGVMFPGINAGFVFFVTLFFTFSLVSLILLVYTLFNRAVYGAAFIMVLLLIVSQTSAAVENALSPEQFKALGFISPYCLQRSVTLFSQGIESSSATGFSIDECIVWMFFDTILYLVVAWYIDKVRPGEFGTPLPWYFPFSPTYWRGVKGDTDLELPEVDRESNASDDSSFEDDGRTDYAVRVANLVKVFRKNPLYATAQDKLAVNGMSFDMREGEVFSLLGHNGAGKTTTINMLVGLSAPSSGDTVIFGKSIKQQLDEIRTNVGWCPQHSVLFDELTVVEHLELFAKVKKIPEDKFKSEIGQALDAVELRDKRHNLVKQLSGGMQRRLNIAIAYLGGSQLIVLDEPTAGLDPVSRRRIWDIIQSYKKSRVTLLTTHFLDEADVLGDRIGIVANGKMRCCGSSLFLKNRFGLGYHLHVIRKQGASPEGVRDLVVSEVPTADVQAALGTESAFRLPLGETPKFPALLRSLKDKADDAGVQSFGLSLTTLEEVFLAIADETDEFAGDKGRPDAAGNKAAEDTDLGGRLMLRRTSSAVKSQDGEEQGTDHTSAVQTDAKSLQPTVSQQIGALLAKRFLQTKRSSGLLVCNILTPVLITILAAVVATASTRSDPQPYLAVSDPSAVLKDNSKGAGLWNSQNVSGRPIVAKQINDISVSTINSDNPAKLVSFFEGPANDKSKRDENLLYPFGIIASPSTYGSQGGPSGHPLALFQLMINRRVTNSLPFALSYVYSNLDWVTLNNTQQIAAPKFTFKVGSEPLTVNQNLSSSNAASFVLVIGIALCLLPGFPAYVATQERVSKARHLLRVMGMPPWAYWVAQFCFDYLLQFIFILSAIIILRAFDIKGLENGGFGAVIIFLVWATINNIFFSNLLSFSTEEPVFVQIISFLLNFFLGWFGGLIYYILNLIGTITKSSGLRTAADVIFWMLGWLPNFNFIVGCLRAISPPLDYNPFIEGKWIDQDLERLFKPDTKVLDNVYWMVAQTILFPIILALVESGKLDISSIVSKLFSSSLPLIESHEPAESDVEDESRRVDASQQGSDVIQLRKLRKVYPGRGSVPPKSAVQGMSLGIPTGEVFGLLGSNGAGKTTTMKMLTGDISVTAGDAFVDGHSVVTDMQEAYASIGYCPQFDALWPDVTGKEHLVTFARVKGVEESQIENLVEATLDRMALRNYADKLAGDYSGGNRRKLSVALALFAGPRVVYLDEPSTGMDPASRRFMWDVISGSAADRALILTTHSMEEADALCHRLGIVCNGRLECLGSSQHLKQKYGDGYICEVRVPAQRQSDAFNFVMSIFPTAKCTQQYNGSLSFNIPDSNVDLAASFETFESQKANLNILDYSIGQTTLEQVFISFVRKQSDPDEELNVAVPVASAPAVQYNSNVQEQENLIPDSNQS